MKWIALGAVAGAVIVLWRVRPAALESSCCKRVAAGAREKAVDNLGAWAGGLGDAIGLWPVMPSVLDTVGVPP